MSATEDRSNIPIYYSDEDSFPGESLSQENLNEEKPSSGQLTAGRQKLKSWLNKTLRIVMTDGRTLVGEFLCTDADANIILGICSEQQKCSNIERYLGLVMVPGRHIVTMEVDIMRKS